jgi:hypothetical protein
MTNCWPSDALRRVPRRRASGSTVPPGGKGTMKRTGLVGQSVRCAACAGTAKAASVTTAAARARVIACIMSPPIVVIVSG